MKKIIKLTLAVTCVMFSTSLFAQKFARINMQEIVMAMPEFEQMQKDVEAFSKELGEQLEAIQVEFNNKYAEYQKNRESLSESVRNLKEQELQSLQQRYTDFQQIAQNDLEKKQAELFQPIHQKAMDAVKKISAAGGYTAVFDTTVQALAYYNESTVADIAPAVRAELKIPEKPATEAAAAAPAAK